MLLLFEMTHGSRETGIFDKHETNVIDANAFQSILRKNDSARPGPRGNTSLWQQQSISQPARCQYMNMTASLTEYPIHPVSLFLPLSLVSSSIPRCSSDRNVKRDHYSPYDIANIVNSPSALCGLSITLSVRTMYAFCARVSHAYDITLSLKWRCDIPARVSLIYILIISLDEIFPRNGFEENIFRLYLSIFLCRRVYRPSSVTPRRNYVETQETEKLFS